MRATHSYAVLKVSPEAFSEILDKLLAAGYQDQVHNEAHNNEGRLLIDMHGIALVNEEDANT